ncbi:pathogenesis-related protein 1C-like [Cicer arietinum]
MHTFLFFIVLLIFLTTSTIVGSTNEQPPLMSPAPPHKGGHHGHRRRNTAKFFGYIRKNQTAYLHNQTELANEFVYAHNWVRNEYKLPALTWDESLASIARKYLMERYEDCKLVHSNESYGENMFWGKKLHWTPCDAVYYWYMEKNYYDFKTLKCEPPPKFCEHFTQIVWRDSTHVGCALQHCHLPESGMLIACEYDPPGNYINENPLLHST